jgi:hypothetical protein
MEPPKCYVSGFNNIRVDHAMFWAIADVASAIAESIGNRAGGVHGYAPELFGNSSSTVLARSFSASQHLGDSF